MVCQSKINIETKKQIQEKNQQVKKAFIRELYPKSKKKRKEIYKDNRKLYKKNY